MLSLLRSDFFPHEPCAVGLSLCPAGYRIPALEEDIRRKIREGRSFLASQEESIP